MNKITPEKTHQLLEKLTEYIMAEIPAIKERQNKLTDYVVSGFEELGKKIDEKADKKDTDTIIATLDSQAKNIAELRLEHKAISRTFDRHEKRITNLEEKETGYRVRDKE